MLRRAESCQWQATGCSERRCKMLQAAEMQRLWKDNSTVRMLTVSRIMPTGCIFMRWLSTASVATAPGQMSCSA